jgi:hypothetical protein
LAPSSAVSTASGGGMRAEPYITSIEPTRASSSSISA